MQFLAFLKDSLREARNGWVLQAMLILSTLLVVFVASISFRPIGAKETLEIPLSWMNWTFKNDANLSGTSFEVENYQASNAAEPWKSDYQFDFVVKASTAEQMGRLQEKVGLPVNRGRVGRFVQQTLSVLDNVKTKEVEGGPPNVRRFHVTTHGTKAADVTAWPHMPSVLFGIEAPLFVMTLRQGVFTIQNYIVGGAGAWIILFISVILTSLFIPNLLQKGAVDLAISKPIPRWRLLVYKYLGGMTFTAILTTFTVGGSWLALGLRTGMWTPSFLLSIPLILAYFAVLYAVSAFVAVLTRSGIVAILATFLAWGLFFGIGIVNNRIEGRERRIAEQAAPGIPENPDLDDIDDAMARIDPNAPLWIIPRSTFGVFKAVHAVSPRTFQIDQWLSKLIADGILTEDELKKTKAHTDPSASWPEAIAVSFAFVLLVLGLASWRFETRSY